MLGIDILKLLGSSGASGGGGGSVGGVKLTSTTVFGETYANWILDFGGFVYKQITSGAAVQDVAWITPQVGMDQYDARATLLSGTPPENGALNTWQNLGSVARTWGWTNETLNRTTELKIEIRRVSGGAVVATCTVNIETAGTA